MHLEEGPFLDGQLALSIEMNRINWVLDPPSDPAQGIEDVPSLGAFPVVRNAFLRQVLHRLPSAPLCHRLAFAARLLLPVPGREDGYRSLSTYLPFAPDPEGSSELKYQINRHCRSRVQPGLKINRLQTWSSVFFRTSLTTESGHVPAPKILLNEKWSIALELDVNTDADALDQLPKEQVAALLGELADLASGVVIEGDRP
jgi:hypothetical protein